MDNFKRGNRFSDGGGRGKRSGGKNFGGGRGGDRRAEMFSTVCSDCGKKCEVPFRPIGEKPVFCSDCFRNKGDNNFGDFRGKERMSGGRNFKPRFDDRNKEVVNYKAQFETLNAKLDKILKLLNPITEEAFVVGFSKSKKSEKSSKPKKKVSVSALKKAIKKTTAK
ncbi:hypothetical protein COU49_00845 [Candidatus Nomurabacteria bacterium CG10_big_fil_rev_8_21_14_0_10_35_16]|uniref:CxxC-x17-CxxC domain-containing protein n=1 Tax=Candidatus Nomurabacteria bacterium CG10_big_fil_rev_8_21_14_0_10_35_16 TaxID=1974731 RepID=A0A2H0TBU9_9BACT|nr:MAG: hypothetical protein COU49_00845 [Candidatus Nomurabacteria bacterium CG10_big_fil_rev_8_21_14_0_10_35_16]